jgi:hypothetical protein
MLTRDNSRKLLATKEIIYFYESLSNNNGNTVFIRQKGRLSLIKINKLGYITVLFYAIANNEYTLYRFLDK